MAEIESTELQYPGDWVAEKLLEGTMQAHRDQVEAIAHAIGSSMEPDNSAYVNRFKVESSTSDRHYVVSQRRTSGEWCCGCRGWITHRRCKHLKDILERLGSYMATADALGENQNQSTSVMTMLASAKDAYSLLSGIK